MSCYRQLYHRYYFLFHFYFFFSCAQYVCLSFTRKINLESQKPAFVETMSACLRKRLLTLHSDATGTATLDNLHDFFFSTLPPFFFFFFFSCNICFNPSFFLPARHGLVSTSRWSSGTASHLQKGTHTQEATVSQRPISR